MKPHVENQLLLSALYLGSQCVSSITRYFGSRMREEQQTDVSFYGTSIHNSAAQLQSTISAATSGVGEAILPHHPITCSSILTFDEDNNFACDHALVPADDPRTQSCLNHSLVLLILEPAVLNQDWKFKTIDQLEYEWFEKTGEVWK